MVERFLVPELALCKENINEQQVKILLIAGGRSPATVWLQKIAAGRIVYCADHGLDSCLHAGVKPNYILGDGDSANSANWSWAKSAGIPFAQFPTDKDLTDTQLALRLIAEHYPHAEIILTGAWGGRFDHLFSSVFSLSRMADKDVNLCVADEKETLIYLKNADVSFKCMEIPLSISLLPLSNTCSGVSINGVKWPLDEVTLLQDNPYAVSNVLHSANEFAVKVKVKEGLLGVYFCWQDFGKN